MALGQQHRYREALDAFNRALEVDRIPILTTMLAHTHAISGDREMALKLSGGDSAPRVAAAIELILEGLHLHNQLNKSAAEHGAVYGQS